MEGGRTGTGSGMPPTPVCVQGGHVTLIPRATLEAPTTTTTRLCRGNVLTGVTWE